MPFNPSVFDGNPDRGGTALIIRKGVGITLAVTGGFSFPGGHAFQNVDVVDCYKVHNNFTVLLE